VWRVVFAAVNLPAFLSCCFVDQLSLGVKRQMMVVSRYLTITQGNIDNSHMYLTQCMDMFPDDVLGGTDESQEAPRTVRVQWGDDVVETDIVRDKHIFRRRGWVRRFFSEAHNHRRRSSAAGATGTLPVSRVERRSKTP
jgi:hypothetical protein